MQKYKKKYLCYNKLKVKYKIEIINEYIPVVGMPIIFSVNHQDFRDAPIT